MLRRSEMCGKVSKTQQWRPEKGKVFEINLSKRQNFKRDSGALEPFRRQIPTQRKLLPEIFRKRKSISRTHVASRDRQMDHQRYLQTLKFGGITRSH